MNHLNASLQDSQELNVKLSNQLKAATKEASMLRNEKEMLVKQIASFEAEIAELHSAVDVAESREVSVLCIIK